MSDIEDEVKALKAKIRDLDDRVDDLERALKAANIVVPKRPAVKHEPTQVYGVDPNERIARGGYPEEF